MNKVNNNPKPSQSEYLRCSTNLIADGFLCNLSASQKERCLKIVNEYEGNKPTSTDYDFIYDAPLTC